METIKFKGYIFEIVENKKSSDIIDTFLVKYNNKYYLYNKYKNNHNIDIQKLIDNYYLLVKLRINVPKLFDYSLFDQVIIIEYVEGNLISELVKNNALSNTIFFRVMTLQSVCKKNNLLLDFNSANFILNKQIMYYNCFVINRPYNESKFDEYLSTWLTKPSKEDIDNIKKKYVFKKKRGFLW